MSRKSIILSLLALAVMFVGIGVAVLFLYSDVDMPSLQKKTRVTDDGRHALLSAVPSDAVLAAYFSDMRSAAPDMIDGLVLPESIKKSAMAVSLHYSGKLMPLYIFKASSDDALNAGFAERLRSAGLTVQETTGLLVASESETLVKSSSRHIAKKVSILDASGFEDILASVSGENVAVISNAHAKRLLPAVMASGYSKYSDFFIRLADWMAFEINASDSRLFLKGSTLFDEDATDFMTVLQNSAPSSSSVASVLPSYTLFALTLPMRDFEPYMAAYQSYLDTRQKLQANLALRQTLAKDNGSAPQDIMRKLEVREIATASFLKGGKVEKINLIKVGNKSAQFVDSISYSDMVPALFGDVFACGKGAESVFVNGWIVSGSKEAIEEYRNGEALKYTLKTHMEAAGNNDMSSSKSLAALAYFSFTEDPGALKDIFSSGFTAGLRSLYDGADVAPAILSVTHAKEGMSLEFNLRRLELKETDEAVFERDTVVVIPTGPFQVKNSGTGKMNEFFQNSHLSLCLREGSKDLWGVPFDKPICGTAQTVDFYTNGKLQILFGAGSSLYLIDRLGRYVSGFPVDLKKDILLGPDVYDFSGKRKYNVMILHKDNTIDMYNLQGVKPAAWKGISVGEEKIKALPERIDLSGSTYWVVRTSVQTLIFPFYGGEPLTVFSGKQRIRPDSQIKAVDGTTVEFTCHDGKVRTYALK